MINLILFFNLKCLLSIKIIVILDDIVRSIFLINNGQSRLFITSKFFYTWKIVIIKWNFLFSLLNYWVYNLLFSWLYLIFYLFRLFFTYHTSGWFLHWSIIHHLKPRWLSKLRINMFWRFNGSTNLSRHRRTNVFRAFMISWF